MNVDCFGKRGLKHTEHSSDVWNDNVDLPDAAFSSIGGFVPRKAQYKEQYYCLAISDFHMKTKVILS